MVRAEYIEAAQAATAERRKLGRWVCLCSRPTAGCRPAPTPACRVLGALFVWLCAEIELEETPELVKKRAEQKEHIETVQQVVSEMNKAGVVFDWPVCRRRRVCSTT